jgi:hypothetical protein
VKLVGTLPNIEIQSHYASNHNSQIHQHGNTVTFDNCKPSNNNSISCQTKKRISEKYQKRCKVMKLQCIRLRKRLQDKDNTIFQLKTKLSNGKCLKFQNLPLGQHMLFENQVVSLDKKKINWKPKDIKFALTIYFKSSAAYETLRTHLKLPCIRTLKNHTKLFLRRPGFCPKIMEAIGAKMSSSSKHEKLVLIILLLYSLIVLLYYFCTIVYIIKS